MGGWRGLGWRPAMWIVPLVVLAVCAGVAGLELPSRAAVGGAPPSSTGGGSASSRWVATWGASPQPANRSDPRALRGFDAQTIREIVFPSVGGSLIRVRFTNLYGSRPLRIGRAAIASGLAGPGVTAGQSRPLSFAGSPSVTIAPGREVTSDPVRISVRPLHDLAISVFLPLPTGPATGHSLAEQRTYIAPGDHVLAPELGPSTQRAPSWFFLDDVSVAASPEARGAVVAIGDSITDGFRSSPNANLRWPNDLARRLDASSAAGLSIIDEGIAGNRVLTPSRCYGPDAVARFRRDALDQPGVRDVILLEGTNDIGLSESTSWCSAPHRDVSARQIIAGDERIIREAHRAGVRIFGATLIPFGGARYWTPAGEAKRQAINRWIRASGAFDGVIDFAKVLADPRDPQFIAPRYDSGDHLHPDDAGYQAMADAVDLAMLVRR
jgi:lysophospholipase L1-like esterase